MLLAVVGVGMGALSYALAIACPKNQEMFCMVQQSLRREPAGTSTGGWN